MVLESPQVFLYFKHFREQVVLQVSFILQFFCYFMDSKVAYSSNPNWLFLPTLLLLPFSSLHL